MGFISIFTNRELAIGIWIIVMCIWMFFNGPTLYKKIVNLCISLAKAWKIFLPMILYVLLSVFVLYKLCIWNKDHIKITIFWLFGSAVVTLFKSTKFVDRKTYVKETIFNMLSLSVFISFISNFYNFSLFTELLLIPCMVLVGGMSTVAVYNPKYRIIEKITKRVLIGVGLIIFMISFYKTIVNFGDFATVGTLFEFIIPILLSLMFIPFTYACLIYSEWEQKQIRMKFVKKINVPNI